MMDIGRHPGALQLRRAAHFLEGAFRHYEALFLRHFLCI